LEKSDLDRCQDPWWWKTLEEMIIAWCNKVLGESYTHRTLNYPSQVASSPPLSCL
jgi:hypothetical protein